MNDLSFPGEIEVIKMELHSPSSNQVTDVRFIYTGFNIYEDIFSPFISGNIVIQDAVGMLHRLPVIGEEILELELITPGLNQLKKQNKIKGKFYVYKITDREYAANRMVTYTLHFVSIEAVMDLNIKLSKGYNNPKISDIASDILRQYSFFANEGKEPSKEQLERFNIEETANGHAYVSNYWSPVKNLNYLAEYAVTKPIETANGKTEGSPTFLFFENRNGLSFVSLESLFKNQTVVRTFRKDDYSRDVYKSGDTVYSKISIEKAYSRIIDLNILESFDYIERCRGGAYASNRITYDLTTKTNAEVSFNFKDNYEKEIRLNTYPPLSKKSIHTKETNYITLFKSTGLHFGNFDITNSKNIQRRTSMLKLLDSQRVEIEILGRTDYTVGQKVELQLYKMTNLELETDENDNLLSGVYLITAVRHIVTTERHVCVMELCKDSMIIDLNKQPK